MSGPRFGKPTCECEYGHSGVDHFRGKALLSNLFIDASIENDCPRRALNGCFCYQVSLSEDNVEGFSNRIKSKTKPNKNIYSRGSQT